MIKIDFESGSWHTNSMFSKMFKKTIPEFDPLADTPPHKDAEAILVSTPHVILVAAWEEYQRIKTDEDSDDPHTVSTPVWKALEKVVAVQGNLKKFTKHELPLLYALRDGHLMYNDLIHVLIDHHSDHLAAENLFKRHPDLHHVIPKQFDTPQHLIDAMIELIRDYQWQIEHFAQKHKERIAASIERLERQ